MRFSSRMKFGKLTAIALLATSSLGGVALSQDAPPAGGAAGPPGGVGAAGGLPPGRAAPMAVQTLVPDMAATIDLEVPGGLQGPQGTIRIEYSGLGEEEGGSPPLEWNAGPEGTQSYAVVLQDLAATGDRNSIVQWTIFNIPGDVTALPGSIPEGEEVVEVEGARQFSSYRAPGPPGLDPPVTPVSGEDWISLYTFQIFALDTTLDIAEGATFVDVVAAMEGHVLAYGLENALLQRPPGDQLPAGFAPPDGAPPGGLPQ